MGTLLDEDWKAVEKPNGVAYQLFIRPIVKSEQDDRNYRIIQLENGLQVILVHDAKADKGAASLDVAVGHLYDADDMPGLAHFCEHLLSMGTVNFPQENEYDEFLSKNNGSSNAYTSTSNTNYYFYVAISALPGALERFAAFFHCPLFSSSSISRGLDVVDSEHENNRQEDRWRISQLDKHLTRPSHPWSKFGTGNRDSLSKAARDLKAQGTLGPAPEGVPSASLSVNNTPIFPRMASPARSITPTKSTNSEASDGGSVGRETRRRLVEWWSKEYCASRMRLSIVGKESLDELTELATKLFSPIPNRGRDRLPMINEHPFGPEEKGTLVFMQTVMDFHAVEISFPLEYQPRLWRYKPGDFLARFVGHEGPGSLHSYLKNKHWATFLGSGSENLAREFSMFKIAIHLTPEGFNNYRSVILAAFNYLALLRSSTFESFHHEEGVKLSEIHFRFAEKRCPDDYAMWLSEHMAWPIPRDLLLAAPRLTWGWDNEEDRRQGEARVKEYLDNFRIGEGRAVLMAKKEDHLKLNPDLQWETEPWYGTEYAVQRFDDDFVTKAQGPNTISEFYLPGCNEFIPNNLDVDKKEVVEPLERPRLVRETQLSTLWYKKDDRFWVPKAHVIVDLRSSVANASARASVLTRMYSDIVNDSLTEFSYDPELAGLSYICASLQTGLHVAIHGFNDKMSVLVRHILEKAKGLVVDPKRLAVVKEAARREWVNFFLGEPYLLSDYYGRYLMTERQWTIEEKLRELPSITAEEVELHTKNFLSEVSVRILAIGNLHRDEAIKIAEMVEEGLGASPLSPTELNDRCLLMPQGSNFIWSSPIPNTNQANSSLTYFTYYGPITDQRSRVVSSLLSQIMSEPAFDVLRTREQLGYIVFCSSWELPGSSEGGLRIVVQSEKKPEYLETRVEAFLDEMKIKIGHMSEEEFNTHKHGLAKKWLEADKNLAEEASRLLTQISTGHWDFFRNERDAGLLPTITKDEMLEFFLKQVHPSSPTRSKLSVHMVSQKSRPKIVSAAAAEPFEILVREQLPEVDQKAWNSLVNEENPSLVQFGKYWAKVLDSEEGKNLLLRLPNLVDKYPVEGEGDDRMASNATYIKDMKSFKAGLAVSVDPGHMVQWNDLPVPCF